MALKSGVHIRSNAASLKQLHGSLLLLTENELLVGFPEDTTTRTEDDHGMTNAALAYIHDNGSPEANIPARSFMLPAMEQVTPKAERKFASVAHSVLRRGADEGYVEAAFHNIGLEAQLAIQNAINAGIPPPLADATLRARARNHKGRVGPGLELLSRSMGYAPSMDFVIPLIEHGWMRNAATYVIRPRKQRKK